MAAVRGPARRRRGQHGRVLGRGRRTPGGAHHRARARRRRDRHSTTRSTGTSLRPSRRSSRSAARPASCCASAASWPTRQPDSVTERGLCRPSPTCSRRWSTSTIGACTSRTRSPAGVTTSGTAAAIAAALKARLDPGKPPHVGVLLQNTPFFSAVLVAAGADGHRAGRAEPDPARRGARPRRHARRLPTGACRFGDARQQLGEVDYIDVDSPEWAAEVAAHRGRHRRPRTTPSPDDLFMLIYTSGTSGEPKAVQVQPRQGGDRGRDDDRNASRSDPTTSATCRCRCSTPTRCWSGWAVALACRGSLVLRRKFSASQFLPDIRRYGATYANYVGKPLSYVLATPERDDDADNPLRAVYGNEGAPRRRRAVRPAFRHRGDGRIRFHRGRYRDRPHARHPGRAR